MENKYRVNFQVDTEVPQEFFFNFFLRSIVDKDFSIPLRDISVSTSNFLAKTRKLEDGRDFRNYRFMSISRILQDMPFDTDTLQKLPDSEFAQEMCMRFEKAKFETKKQITTLFSLEANELLCPVYQDLLVRWSVPVVVKKEKTRKPEQGFLSVPVGYCIA